MAIMTSVAEDGEKLEPLSNAGRNVKWYSPVEKVLWVHKKSNFEFPHYPAIPLLGIHSRELNTYVHTKYVYSMEYCSVKKKKKSADTYNNMNFEITA